MSIDRRSFLKTSALAFGALATGLAPFDLFAADSVKLSILHTNDMHSRVDPFPDTAGNWAGLGGVARRAKLIADIRAKEKNVLLLDVGDIFQGTPYYNFFGGEVELKSMSQMGYDAATLGNHDFDNGLEGFLKQFPHANFPFICSNYDFSNTILKGKTIPYKVFDKSGIKIGVFGLGIELEGLVFKKFYGDTKYSDPVAVSNEMVQELKIKGCDLIVCLSHLGHKYRSDDKICDMILAQKVSGIDLILGGHTHTFLDRPVLVDSPSGTPVIISQVGWAGINLGKVDFYFSKKSKQKFIEGRSLVISEKSKYV